MECGLSLGSNIDDRFAHLVRARADIAALPATRLAACSPVYETEPVDVGPQYGDLFFLNAVLIVETDLSVADLAERLQAIETALGRVRSADRNAPRPIDIDLIYAAGATSATPRLTLPHPRWAQRRFVVQPLADVRAQLVLPGQTRTVAEALAALPAAPRVRFFRAWPLSSGAMQRT